MALACLTRHPQAAPPIAGAIRSCDLLLETPADKADFSELARMAPAQLSSCAERQPPGTRKGDELRRPKHTRRARCAVDGHGHEMVIGYLPLAGVNLDGLNEVVVQGRLRASQRLRRRARLVAVALRSSSWSGESR